MKTRSAVSSALALGALAVLLVACERSGSPETEAAAGDSGLANMAVPGANAATVIEPRDTVAAAPAIPASTTPVTSTKSPAAAKPAAAAPSTKPTAPATTPVSNTNTTPTPTPVTPAPVVTPTPAPVTPPVAPPVAAPAAVSGVLTLQTGSRLWVDGGSTVRDWSCKAGKLDARVVTTKADAPSAIIAGEKAVSSVELTVPVMSLDCSNGTMDGHLRNALDAKAHPTITFSLRSYELAKSAENVAVTLSGTLAIHGKSLQVSFPATAATAADGALRLTGVYELNMKDYGVKPPSLMLGTMNVREKVKVRFDLLLRN